MRRVDCERARVLAALEQLAARDGAANFLHQRMIQAVNLATCQRRHFFILAGALWNALL